jgi:hypothetical protein
MPIIFNLIFKLLEIFGWILAFYFAIRMIGNIKKKYVITIIIVLVVIDIAFVLLM